MITCLVAMPDSVHPNIEYSFSDEQQVQILPVYPTPEKVFTTSYCTESIVDSFYQDSTAYALTDFWPSERVRLIGETRICDQRLLKIQLFPALYRAADSTLSTVTSFSVSVSFDSSQAVWSSIGLGSFQELISGTPIIGYHAVDQTIAPVPEYFGVVDARDGPQYPDNRMPDYIIISASGLYNQCSAAIDDLAEHRVTQNSFDVATVLTDNILDDFGGFGQTVITDETIRDFTEHMWNNWAQNSVKKPAYLLLIGDHEDPSYGSADWFLPTHLYDDWLSDSIEVLDVGNDEWYVYMNNDRDINNDTPSMAVGRFSIKNGSTLRTDTLSVIIQNIINMEDPITQIPIPDYRRRISRLAGTGTGNGTGYQTPCVWHPSLEWTEELTDWLGYEFSTNYCGDGRDFIDKDGSLMASWMWRERCLAEYEIGAGVVFYSNHGHFHMFSAGLEWLHTYIPLDPYTKGTRDSTFNNYQVNTNLVAAPGHTAPFTLLLCCTAGTFNHTIEEHEDTTAARKPEFCFFEGSSSPPVNAYDFGSDCLAECLFKNTEAPVAGVFAGSRASLIECYGTYGEGILEGIYTLGIGKLGAAIKHSRLSYYDYYSSMDGSNLVFLGQFNLLGDPALDISDYVRYPNSCDLVVYQDNLEVFPYPAETSSGAEMDLNFIVRNNGRQNSGSFSTKISISDGSDTSINYISCASISSRTEETYSYTWTCPVWLDTPSELSVTIEADYQQSCSDSWRGNNSATQNIQVNDIYPFNSGWPIEVTGNVSTTPILANLDSDEYLEVIVRNGTSLTAFDHDGTLAWSLSDQDFHPTRHPLVADLDIDGNVELLVSSGSDKIKVISHEGRVLHTLDNAGSIFAVGQLHPRTGLELCTASADGRYLKLYYWDNNQMNLITTKDMGYTDNRSPISLTINDLSTSSYDDIGYLYGGVEGDIFAAEKTSILVYNWFSSTEIYWETWDEYLFYGSTLASGTLSSNPTVGYPIGTYDSTDAPALLIEPDESTPEIACLRTNVSNSNSMKYGVIADWTASTGTDIYVLPSNRQCMAWDVDGAPFSVFPTSEFGGDTEASQISPTALGNLDNTDNDDVLFATVLNDNWTLIGLDSDGLELSSVGFPYILPESVSASGGFAIGDIDRDGKVEIVFGTNDGLLHCWELESCVTGYAPWPQFQHDSGRSGALE